MLELFSEIQVQKDIILIQAQILKMQHWKSMIFVMSVPILQRIDEQIEHLAVFLSIFIPQKH